MSIITSFATPMTEEFERIEFSLDEPEVEGESEKVEDEDDDLEEVPEEEEL